MRGRWTVVALALLASITACVPTNPTQTRTVAPLATTCDTTAVPGSIEVNGRVARLVAPQRVDRSTPQPLLVSLHPFTLGAEAWESYSGLAAAASERGMWTLIPEGVEGGPRWSVPGGVASDTDDVAYIDALIQQTAREVCIDSDRVFAAGFSAGAALAVGLSCELPGRFRAIAASGGANLTSLCPEAAPTGAFIMHGTDDTIVPPHGNDVPFTPPTGISVRSVVDSFASRNDCDERPATHWRSATLGVTAYTCTAAPVVEVSVVGMGHVWAGGSGLISWIAPPVDPTINASNLVLDFFSGA